MSMTEDPMYTCPSCGFVVFEQQPGSSDLCDVCGWEDDVVQLQHPSMSGGANELSLGEHQREVLVELPETLREHRGYSRDSTWRPLKPAERRSAHAPKTTAEYVDAFHAEDAVYYWFHRAKS